MSRYVKPRSFQQGTDGSLGAIAGTRTSTTRRSGRTSGRGVSRPQRWYVSARASGQSHYRWYTSCPCALQYRTAWWQSTTSSRQAESDEDSIGDSDGPPPAAVVPNAVFNAKVRNGAGRATLHVERSGLCACMVYRAEIRLRLPAPALRPTAGGAGGPPGTLPLFVDGLGRQLPRPSISRRWPCGAAT